ncbi:MAG: SPFH domain-containing protein [Clostridia bacterium]|nr:SPFH domain-containing protein [Clostridia bacterium]
MEIKKITAKELKAANGILMLFAIITGLILSIGLMVAGAIMVSMETDLLLAAGVVLLVLSVVLMTVFCIMFGGLKVVQPNEAKVFTLFGKYHGTISTSGFFYVNPFSKTIAPVDNTGEGTPAIKAKASSQEQALSVSLGGGARSVSLKTQTLNNGKQKVNDILGNPIIIGAIVIWHVADPTQAVFAVENYKEYLSIQTDSIVRNTARLYPYDIFDDDDDGETNAGEKSLRGSALEIADNMKNELQSRVKDAGLEIEEVRITHLAYSEEIAAAMLQRQQAAAIIAARQKIVDGAVGMVKMAIDRLSEDEVVVLDDERKAVMVSNLLVVLCGNKDAQPVVNSGSIY